MVSESIWDITAYCAYVCQEVVQNMAERELIPTLEELAELPKLAVVAFAARCARRVQPFFRQDWPSKYDVYFNSVENAISAAET